MTIENVQRINHLLYLKEQQRIKEEIRPIEPVSQIEPALHIPDNAYLESMQVLGTIIDIKI